MRPRAVFSAVFFILCALACAFAEPAAIAQSPLSEIPLVDAFKKNDRVLILAPHPDDEAIACAGIIQDALNSGAEVRVTYLTNGDHNEFAFIVYELVIKA